MAAANLGSQLHFEQHRSSRKLMADLLAVNRKQRRADQHRKTPQPLAQYERFLIVIPGAALPAETRRPHRLHLRNEAGAQPQRTIRYRSPAAPAIQVDPPPQPTSARMVKAACECVMVTRPGETATRSASSESSTGSSAPSKYTDSRKSRRTLMGFSQASKVPSSVPRIAPRCPTDSRKCRA